MGEAGNVWGYVIAAYAVTWIGLMSYAARLWVLTRRAKDAAIELGGEG